MRSLLDSTIGCAALFMILYQVVEKHHFCHCEERFSRRGNLKLIDFIHYEIASLRSQRPGKDHFNNLL